MGRWLWRLVSNAVVTKARRHQCRLQASLGRLASRDRRIWWAPFRTWARRAVPSAVLISTTNLLFAVSGRWAEPTSIGWQSGPVDVVLTQAATIAASVCARSNSTIRWRTAGVSCRRWGRLAAASTSLSSMAKCTPSAVVTVPLNSPQPKCSTAKVASGRPYRRCNWLAPMSVSCSVSNPSTTARKPIRFLSDLVFKLMEHLISPEGKKATWSSFWLVNFRKSVDSCLFRQLFHNFAQIRQVLEWILVQIISQIDEYLSKMF